MLGRLKHYLKELLILGILAIIVANVSSILRSPTLVSNKLPELNLELIDQQSFQSSNIEGSLVLYFWGSWCSVCSFQSPVISDLSKTVQVLSFAVNSGTNRQIQAYLKQSQYSFPTYNDQQNVWSKTFKVKAYPTLFIFDKKGKLRFSEVGYTSYWGLRLRLLWLELW